MKNFTFVVILSFLGFKNHAQWSDTPITALPHTPAYTTSNPTIVSDGSGGAFIVWKRDGSPEAGLYAQHVSDTGEVLWNTQGVMVASSGTAASIFNVVPDNQHGIIVSWHDVGLTPDIHSQRIDGSGNMLWSQAGVIVCAAATQMVFPKAVADSEGGAFIVWQESINGSGVFAQYVSDLGIPNWALNGIAILDTPYIQKSAKVVGDGNGGMIVGWVDAGLTVNYYAQRFSPLGTKLWGDGGKIVANSAYATSLLDLAITADLAGNSTIAYIDHPTNSAIDINIKAQKLDIDGNKLWDSAGMPICSASDIQSNIVMGANAQNYNFISWVDKREAVYERVYSQVLDNDGNAVLPTDGKFVKMPSFSSHTQLAHIVANNSTRDEVFMGILEETLQDGNIRYLQKIANTNEFVFGDDATPLPMNASDFTMFLDDSGYVLATWRATTSSILVQKICNDGVTGNCILANETFEAQPKVDIYPNPAHGYFQVNIDQPVEILLVKDLHGKILTSMEAPSNNQKIDVHGLPVGVYMVTIVSKGTAITRKLVVK
jgi:type IX secretion system substrate protein